MWRKQEAQGECDERGDVRHGSRRVLMGDGSRSSSAATPSADRRQADCGGEGSRPETGATLDADDASLRRRINAVSLADRGDLVTLQRSIRRREQQGQPASVLSSKLERRLVEAEALIARRENTRYRLEYPQALPICTARTDIIAALQAHPVIVVCGDTGSGKTTQLPKLCLEAGRGVAGAIGHTQPRRIAARAVAARLAEELGVPLGGAVGYQVRFTDESNPASLIKVMTDGILLNEIRQDRRLLRYDTLIIDEAHERSLNIDFLLGYLKRLLTERRDLKLIVTSATIDPERFAEHFGGAPILQVPGRSYPVELRYRPPARDEDLPQAVASAVNELARVDLAAVGGKDIRDMLVFLPGERWIHETARILARSIPRTYEILPLYARLTAARQQRVFKPGGKPRIVLATNVAETSLTVPRIRFVIDTGVARISRYSTRQRMQSLGVEPIAKANAVQRAGRCGRLAPGVCIRLFAEDDFDARPDFMEPEILRTDLAGVVLRLESLGLGPVDEFPFIDAPPIRMVNDAYGLLHLLGAIDRERRLTADGKLMARLPLDPRLARLLLVAHQRGVLREGLVIASALSAVDPREQPPEQLANARERHAEFQDTRSDFMTWLTLWRASIDERKKGEAPWRAWCAEHFLSPSRFREWNDVHHQLRDFAVELGWTIHPGEVAAGKNANYEAIHRAVLAGFIDLVARHEGKGVYEGAQQGKATLFPGSGLNRQRPEWIVAAERVATARVYLRTAAQIKVGWIIDAATHLLDRDYFDPYWDHKRGRVMAREVVKFQGLVLGAERRVDFGRIDPTAAREVFIREALVAESLGESLPPLEHNRRLRETLLGWEARRRSRDLFAGERACEAFYREQLPSGIVDRAGLAHWLRTPGHASKLEMKALDIATRDPGEFDEDAYPEQFEAAGHSLPLVYAFEPGAANDGITLQVPLPLLAALRPEPLEWLVPGWLAGKVMALLRALPKPLRRQFVPLPDTVARMVPILSERRGRAPLATALADCLASEMGKRIDPSAFDSVVLPIEFTLRLEVLDADGTVAAASRDLPGLQRRFATRPESGISAGTKALPAHRHSVGPKARDPRQKSDQRFVGTLDASGNRDRHGGLAADLEFSWVEGRANLAQWDLADLPDVVTVHEYGTELHLYPALVDRDGQVATALLPPDPAAEETHRRGVRRLLLKQLSQQVDFVRRSVQSDRQLVLAYHGIGSAAELVDDLVCAGADEVFREGALVRSRAAFMACLEAGRADFVPAVERLIKVMSEVLKPYRELVRRLERVGTQVPEHAIVDLGAQLDGLVHPYFLRETPAEWRSQLPRYIKAATLRLDKLERRSPKDAEHQAAVGMAAARLDAWQLRQSPNAPWPREIQEYRWLLEEFRVSLFAQELGTRRPVSGKRLEAAWERVVGCVGR